MSHAYDYERRLEMMIIRTTQTIRGSEELMRQTAELVGQSRKLIFNIFRPEVCPQESKRDAQPRPR